MQRIICLLRLLLWLCSRNHRPHLLPSTYQIVFGYPILKYLIDINGFFKLNIKISCVCIKILFFTRWIQIHPAICILCIETRIRCQTPFITRLIIKINFFTRCSVFVPLKNKMFLLADNIKLKLNLKLYFIYWSLVEEFKKMIRSTGIFFVPCLVFLTTRNNTYCYWRRSLERLKFISLQIKLTIH